MSKGIRFAIGVLLVGALVSLHVGAGVPAHPALLLFLAECDSLIGAPSRCLRAMRGLLSDAENCDSGRPGRWREIGVASRGPGGVLHLKFMEHEDSIPSSRRLGFLRKPW